MPFEISVVSIYYVNVFACLYKKIPVCIHFIIHCSFCCCIIYELFALQFAIAVCVCLCRHICLPKSPNSSQRHVFNLHEEYTDFFAFSSDINDENVTSKLGLPQKSNVRPPTEDSRHLHTLGDYKISSSKFLLMVLGPEHTQHTAP